MSCFFKRSLSPLLSFNFALAPSFASSSDVGAEEAAGEVNDEFPLEDLDDLSEADPPVSDPPLVRQGPS